MPAVSVIIPVYRRKESIRRSVASVQQQTFADWELIVVDDASDDGTAEFVEAIPEPRLRVLRQEVNGGPGVARQRALEAAQGEFVAFLDSDDECLPGRLTAQLVLAQAGAGVVGGSYHVRQGDDEWTFRHPSVDDWVSHLHFRCMLRAGSTLLVRRELALAVGFDPALRYYEDWDFALRLAERENIRLFDDPIVRIHVGPPRSMAAAEPSIRRFLAKHDAAFRQRGADYRRNVRGQHLQNLSAGAFSERRFGLGARWLAESYLENPRQSPVRLAALALAPIDALLGTSLIEKGKAWQQRRASPAGDRPAP